MMLLEVEIGIGIGIGIAGGKGVECSGEVWRCR